MTTAVQDSQTPRCLTCDYPLMSLSEHRCPECGRAFDPADPRTVRTPRSPGKVAQFLLKPPGWPLFTVAGLASLLSIVAGAAPGGYFVFTGWAIFLWLTLFVFGGFRLLIWGVVRAYFAKDCELGPRYPWRWLVGPLSFTVVVILLAKQAPLNFAFWLSRSSMDTLAKEVMDNAKTTLSSRWVGLFYAEEIEKTPKGMKFTVGGTISWGRSGFEWSPEPSTTTGSHLEGQWYEWIESW